MSGSGQRDSTTSKGSIIASSETSKHVSYERESRSMSIASGSSEGSSDSHMVEQEEMEALTRDVRDLKEAISCLRKNLNPTSDTESQKVLAHDRLSDILSVLRSMLEKYPLLQSNELVASASNLIYLIREFNFDDQDTRIFEDTLDSLAQTVRNRVSEYLSGDIDSSTSTKAKSVENLLEEASGPIIQPPNLLIAPEESALNHLSPEEIDSMLMKHEQGVDHALLRAKIWSKYAKDLSYYIEKRCTYQLEYARNLTKLVQTMRPVLKEESYLPFQSIYCTTLDHDLEMCTSIQSTCRHLNGLKFNEPLNARRSEHEKVRKALKDRWYKELKKMHESVNNLRKAKATYMQRTQDHERCREAVRIAEQGAEIGATGENKVDKRKRLEEESFAKMTESEILYKTYVHEANARHKTLLVVKKEFLYKIRELIIACDQTMKTVTVSYFQLQHGLFLNVPSQFAMLSESSRLYEPGTQFMEYVKRMPRPTSVRFSEPDPFAFETFSEDQLFLFDKHRKSSSSASMEPDFPDGVYKTKSGDISSRAQIICSPNPEPSDTESVESRDSGRSQETSPSASPMIPPRKGTDFDVDHHSGSQNSSSSISAKSFSCRLSKAAQTHKFRKLKTISKCRECDSFLFQGYECQECGLSSHKKCLETLAIQCGHKRLLRKMTTFGVDLSQHLSETGSSIPPLVIKCVHEISKRGIRIKGIYRTSGVKSKVEKLCQSFENGAELVELTDIAPNVVANVLKLYLRQLPEPLLTSKLYSEFIRIAKNCPAKSDVSSFNSELRTLLCKLPKSHYVTLANLMHHLRKVASESELNNMPASNLAIVFGPTLLRTADAGSADLSAVADAVHQARAVELLIINALDIFGPEDNFRPRDFHKYVSDEKPSDNLLDEIDHNPILEAYLREVNSEDDDTDIPDFLLRDCPMSQTNKKSAHTGRSSSPPKIIKQSLKNFSGLEGVTPNMLSTQDSLEVVQRLTGNKVANEGVVLVKQRSAVLSEASETHPITFAKVGKSAKKHSLDDDTYIPQDDMQQPLVVRSYQSSGSGRSSLLISGINSGARSLSDDNSIGTASTKLSNLLNLEENRVKIQVPGGITSSPPFTPKDGME